MVILIWEMNLTFLMILSSSTQLDLLTMVLTAQVKQTRRNTAQKSQLALTPIQVDIYTNILQVGKHLYCYKVDFQNITQK